MSRQPQNGDYGKDVHWGTVIGPTGGAGSILRVQPDDMLYPYDSVPGISQGTYGVAQPVPFGFHDTGLQKPQILDPGQLVQRVGPYPTFNPGGGGATTPRWCALDFDSVRSRC